MHALVTSSSTNKVHIAKTFSILNLLFLVSVARIHHFGIAYLEKNNDQERCVLGSPNQVGLVWPNGRNHRRGEGCGVLVNDHNQGTFY